MTGGPPGEDSRGWTQKQQRAETKQLTHKATLSKPGSKTEQDKRLPLADAINEQHHLEIASFHTPGHKGISADAGAGTTWHFDVTELPGLDELSNPSGPIHLLEERAAKTWGAKASFISVNGASAALIAAILACSGRGKNILLPRNVHKSAVHALVMSGLEPIWFEPNFDQDWNVWTNVSNTTIEKQIQKNPDNFAAIVVVSPTYAGCSSDIHELAATAHRYGIPLIVDEAHGAHRVLDSAMPPSAVTQGADAVVHSLHKTLSALTQTGLLHVPSGSLIDANSASAALNLLQSSSPSYLLMASIERCISDLQPGSETLGNLKVRSAEFAQRLNSLGDIEVFVPPFGTPEPTHFLVRMAGVGATQLADACRARGIFSEAVLGEGVLFLAGVGTSTVDFESLLRVLKNVREERAAGSAAVLGGTKARPAVSGSTTNSPSCNARPIGFDDENNGATTADKSTDDCLAALLFSFGEQSLSPREAFFSTVETVSSEHAVGRISADCFAPCPPGTPVLVPGQRITHEVVSFCRKPLYRVVVESSIQGEQ